MVLEDHGHRVGICFCLFAEEGNDGLGHVVVNTLRIEAVQSGRLFWSSNLYIAQQLLRQHATDHGFIAFEELCYQRIGILARIILRLDNIFPVLDISLDVNSHFKRIVVEAFHLHRQSGEGLFVEQRTVPSEHRSHLQS